MSVMEVFKAVADFSPPSSENEEQCLLSFCKGDQFEVLDRTKSDWWGARRLSDNLVGYVPAKYLQFVERRIGKLVADDYHEHRERQLKKFAAMQNSSQHKHPVSIYGEFGVPMDYEIPPLDPSLPASPGEMAAAEEALHRSFYEDLPTPTDFLPPPADELYSEVPEPVPDYQDEDSNDFPPPPPSLVGDSPGDGGPPDPPAIIGVVGNGAEGSPEEGEGGDLIQPRKLFNPCLVSRERQALHKELLLNYKLGKDVLQKPELNKILAKRKETQKRKEWEEMQANRRTSLELRLEEQANKIKEKEEGEKMKTIQEDDKAPEFVQMHRRITHKTPTSPPT